MQIEIFTACLHFETNELGPCIYGINTGVPVPPPPAFTKLCIVLSVRFDETNWQAHKVGLRLFDEGENCIAAPEPFVMRPQATAERHVAFLHHWELDVRFFARVGPYVATLMVDDEPTRSTVIRAVPA